MSDGKTYLDTKACIRLAKTAKSNRLAVFLIEKMGGLINIKSENRGRTMSYCRFIEGDVYAYPCDGGVQFWVSDAAFDRLCKNCVEAYQYAKDLRDVHGLIVPDHAIEELREDAVEEVDEVLRMAETVIGIHPQAEARPQVDDEELRRRNRHLKDENRRLTDLCRRMFWWSFGKHLQCRWCEWRRECEDGPDCIAPRKIKEMARELGIEARQ